VEDWKKGKKQSLGFLVGQVMKATQGKANPAIVNQLLLEKLPKQS
jgi:aspartyl-tRNA(Asn)/glutamyl-tRNA(Gln) amidotransferase subunit B